MRFSLRNKILFLVFLTILLFFTLYFLQYYQIKEEILKQEYEYNKALAESIANKFENFLNSEINRIKTLISVYKGYGLSNEEILWRVSGDVLGVFEGAYYSENGKLVSFVSREEIKPSFTEKLEEAEKIKVKFSQYGEPYIRVIVPDEIEGLVLGYYVFSLDLLNFWQKIIISKSPDVSFVLLDREGNVLAFSDLRYFKNTKVNYREGIYTSDISGKEVLGVYSLSQNGKWVIFIEKSIESILKPIKNLERNFAFFGTLAVFFSSSLVLILLVKIFKPFEEFKRELINWYRENTGSNIRLGDDIQIIIEAFKNLVKMLERQKKVYKFFFEKTFDGVIIFDEKKRVKEINERAVEMLGIKKEVVIGKEMKEIFGREFPLSSIYLSEVKINFGKGILCEAKQEILNLDNKTFIIWRLKDISKEKELENLILRTNKLAIVGEIACFLAHQINNPLASIMGYAELIQMQTEDENLKKKAEFIVSNAKKCGETVKRLLQLSRPYEGKPEYVDPALLTIDVINLLNPKAKKRNVKILFETRTNGKRIFTFPWQIEQVLINIIDNAIDASEKDSQVSIYLTSENGYVKWKIIDRGKGIEDTTKVFEPFYTTKREGTGLGLCIAKKLIENLKGEIKIKSKLNYGTEVEISIPEVIRYEDVNN